MTLLQCRGTKVESKGAADLHPITNEADAIRQAARLTGLDKLTRKIRARHVKIMDERTPFLWEQYIGRMAWMVEFTDVRLKFKTSAPNSEDTYTRKFVTLLDEKTGQLINVTSRFVGKDPDLREQPSGAAAETQLRSEEEMYYGLPKGEPKLTFLSALETVLDQGIGSPFLAKEIFGNYVMHSRGSAPQRAVWVITLRGLPPIPAHGPKGDSIPIWQRNHMRNVIDGETGVNLFSTNSPQPE